MITYTEAKKKSLEKLEDIISVAMRKVNVAKEIDLCQYIPGSKGCLHHFAFSKVKKNNPEELSQMIKEHILEKESTEQVASKPRAAMMVKRTVDIKLKRSQINQLLSVLKNSGSTIQGAEDLISVLTPHQTLGQVQKLMQDMIRAKKVDVGLWETYVKLVEEERAVC